MDLQDRWRRWPVPMVRAKSCKLLRIFIMRELAEDLEAIHNF